MFAKSLLAIGVVAALSACGGGGGDSGTTATPVTPVVVNTAEGLWTGPASTGYTVNMAVLENGESWGVYTSGSTIYGALNGTANGTGTTFSGTGKDFNFLTGSVTAGALTGTVVQKSSISASTNTGGTVSLTYDTAYDQPASLATLAGSYTYTGRTGAYILASNTLVISGTGTFTLSAAGCTTTGSLAPRASGKNIFNFTASFVGACALPTGTSVTGIAYLDTTTAPYRISALGLNAAKTDGIIVIGSKI